MILIHLLILLSKLNFDAEKVEFIAEDGTRVTHLIGNVHLYDRKLDIRGAEAWFNPKENSLVVDDSLVIKAQDVDITGDSLYFDTRKRVSYIHRRVKITRDETIINAPRMVINHRDRTAYIPSGAQIRNIDEGILITGHDVTYDLETDQGIIARHPVLREDSDSSSFTVTGTRMHLDQKEKTASSAQNVKIVTEDATVFADTLTLFYEEDFGTASGNTRIETTDGHVKSDSATFYLDGRQLTNIFLYPIVNTRYRTEGTDHVEVTSGNLDIDLENKGNEILTFTGGAHGTYYWKEKPEEE